jgi:2'-5' RNA ligase
VFLGEAPTDEVSAALDTVPVHESFSLSLSGGGRFGTAAWAAVAGEIPKLRALQGDVRDALADYLSENRPYQPHLTVSYRGDGATRAALAGYAGKPWPVDEFALVSSHDGEYETLRTWPLRPPAGRAPSRASG